MTLKPPKPFSWDLFNRSPIVGIIRGVSFEVVSQILPLYREAGLTTIEITMNTPGAETMIRHALAQESDGLNIGAGTVCNEDDLDKALSAGAQFIVTPVLNKPVIETCVARGVPIFPGAFTPSEIYTAWSLGAAMVKIFPATSVGPDYIKELKGPLNQIQVMPTGGVTLNNMNAFLEAGASGLGIGSQLFDKALIQQKDWLGLKMHFEKFVKNL